MKQIALKVNETDTLIGFAWEVENPVANVVIFQGMEEHSFRYNRLIKFLNDNSINVYSLDVYGQGANVKEDLSNAMQWPADGFFKQVDAFHKMVVEAKKNGLKTFIYSHSMGSTMGQLYIQKYPLEVERIVLCGTVAPYFGFKFAKFLSKGMGTGKRKYENSPFLNKLMFGAFNKRIKNKKTDSDWLSINEENVQAYINDPLCGILPTNGFCYEYLRGLSSLFTNKGLDSISKDQKIFLICGDEDPVARYGKCVEVMAKLYKKHGIKDVRTKIYPHARHEIIAEDCKEEVFNDVLDFFLK